MQSNPVSACRHTAAKNAKSKLTLLLLGILGAFMVLSFATVPVSHAESVPVTQYSGLPLQATLTWNFVQGTNAGNSYFTMLLTLSGSNPPSHVALDYSLYFIPLSSNASWNDVQNHGASLNFNKGVTSQSVSFTLPFKGAGVYLFVSNFEDNSGKMVAQSIVDPKIEPEF